MVLGHRDCLFKCVTGSFSLSVVPVVRPAVGEGDGERVQCGFPSCDLFYPPLAGRVQRPDGQVQALQCGLLVGEVAARPDGAAEPGVEALNRVRRADDPADLHGRSRGTA